MNKRDLVKLGFKHAHNNFMESLYLKTGIDKTKPILVYGIVNEYCNYKCRYCEFWRMPSYMNEISIEDWKNALMSLKEYIGPYHIEFSGGEPFLKEGFIDLIEFCYQNELKWGGLPT